MKAIPWTAGVLTLALVLCGNAQAQTTPPVDDQAAATETDKTPEIVVTAQRRNEDAMTTPVSASVLSGADLEHKGVVNVDALQFAMPSVTVNNFGQGNDFNVRGIGKAEHNTQTTTGVIIYRDGVPTFPGYVQGEPYYDIANIQVLRGPQGTIVGQNATGGAVFVNTNDPLIGGGVHGYVQANYGNYNDAGLQGAINLPLGDTFAIRLAGYGERRDGFFNITGPGGSKYTSGNGGLKMAAGRLSLLWKPSENFSILSKTDVGYMDFGGYPATPYWQTMKTLPNGTANPRYADIFNLTANAPNSSRDKFVRSILRLEYDTDSGIKFRSVTSYQDAGTRYATDLDGTSSDFINPTTGAAMANTYFYDDVREKQVSQEFNIISPDKQRFTWLIGAFGLWNTYTFPAPFDNFDINLCYPNDATVRPDCHYRLKGQNPERSLAVFGQVGFNITNNLKIELGGRYTASQSTNHVDVQQYANPIYSPLAVPPYYYISGYTPVYIRDDQTVKSDNFSYKASLGWKVSPDHYLYAFVATGFRPGGLNVPVGLGLPAPFEPEKVTSFEGGWKANFAGGHVRTTIDGFYNDYRNFQVVIGYPTYPTFGIELNVPNSTRIYGAEAEIEIHSGGFSVDAGIDVQHSELGQFYASDPRVAATGACDPLTGGNAAATNCINLKGRQQTYAPNFTFNIGAQYEIAVGDNDKITPRVNYGHVDAQWATLFENSTLGDRLTERNVVNAQLEWRHQSWTITAYSTNLTNQHYAGALNSGLYFAGPPRQYGIKVFKVF